MATWIRARHRYIDRYLQILIHLPCCQIYVDVHTAMGPRTSNERGKGQGMSWCGYEWSYEKPIKFNNTPYHGANNASIVEKAIHVSTQGTSLGHLFVYSRFHPLHVMRYVVWALCVWVAYGMVLQARIDTTEDTCYDGVWTTCVMYVDHFGFNNVNNWEGESQCSNEKG